LQCGSGHGRQAVEVFASDALILHCRRCIMQGGLSQSVTFVCFRRPSCACFPQRRELVACFLMACTHPRVPRRHINRHTQHRLSRMPGAPPHCIARHRHLHRVPDVPAVIARTLAHRLVSHLAVRHDCTVARVTANWAIHEQHGAICPGQMNFGQWMAIDIPPEKLFKLEEDCRRLESASDIGNLAAMLLRQNYRQRQLLQSAVHEIARLELHIMQR
jgi:hypothetical protein